MAKQDYAHGQYEIGDTIKAFDFQPVGDREDHYVIGEIVDCGCPHQPNVMKYKVDVHEDTMEDINPNGKRETVFVPLGIAIGEFDERVQLVN